MPRRRDDPAGGPLSRVWRFSVGDILAKGLHFLAFVYLARRLGVATYGLVELALAFLAWLLYLADAGVEAWATRQAARSENPAALVGRVLPLRLSLAALALATLVGALPFLPDVAGLGQLLLAFGASLVPQALNPRWLLLGRERMTRAAQAQAVAQVVFAIAVLAAVSGPEDVLWVAAARFLGDLASVVLFLPAARREAGPLAPWTLRGSGALLREALGLGVSRALGLLTYNLDSLLLGSLVGASAVGLYGAAYKPVTAGLALPLTWFLAIYPALSRTWLESRSAFEATVARSLRLSALFAVPLAVGGLLLAAPVVRFLFGDSYAPAAPALAILAVSGATVTLRGTYRMALQAAGRVREDLILAGAAAAANLVLNLALIPRFGIVGAASATVASELLWLGGLATRFRGATALGPRLVRPLAAGVLMGIVVWVGRPLPWPAAGALGVLAYGLALLWMGEGRALLRQDG